MTAYGVGLQSALDWQADHGNPEPTDPAYMALKHNVPLSVTKVPARLEFAWDDGPRQLWSDFHSQAAQLSRYVMADTDLQKSTSTSMPTQTVLVRTTITTTPSSPPPPPSPKSKESQQSSKQRNEGTHLGIGLVVVGTAMSSILAAIALL